MQEARRVAAPTIFFLGGGGCLIDFRLMLRYVRTFLPRSFTVVVTMAAGMKKSASSSMLRLQPRMFFGT